MTVNTVTSDRVGRENKAHAVRAGPQGFFWSDAKAYRLGFE